MVYGIVKQNNGHVTLETEVGAGATFRLYFPCTARPQECDAVPPPAPGAALPSTGARRVVLVVEDEDGVRKLACRVLTMQGYEVLEAHDGQTAVELAERFQQPIDLLVSDMIMPGMNGRQVAQSITQRRTETKVLFMSGHADGVLGRNGLIEQEGTHLLRKPFTPAELAHHVREMLTV
jgi:CheY-like chemotaxis protein